MLRTLPLALALLSATAVGACKNEGLRKIERLTAEFCACRDIKCFHAVAAKVDSELSDEEQRQLMHEDKVEFNRQIQRLMKCLTRIEMNSDEPSEGTHLPLEMPFASPRDMPDFPSQ